MSKEKKNLYTGIIEKDEKGNYHCGRYLLDYRHTESKFKVGDKVYIKSAVANPSDASREQYPMKTKDFFPADDSNKQNNP